MQNYIEIFGSIEKEEHLVSLEKNILPGTMVLETAKPFKGYYSEDPADTVPQTIFFVLENTYSAEEIIRVAQKIKSYSKQDFDAVKADVEIFNKTYTTIRVYDLNNYQEIPQIQKSFKSEGFKMKSKFGNINDDCTIKLKKVFLVEQFGDGLYMNRGKSKMGYFSVPENIPYQMFQDIVKQVKNNWNGRSFDAAKGAFFKRSGIQEIIRIYSNRINENMLIDLKFAFISEYEKTITTKTATEKTV